MKAVWFEEFGEATEVLKVGEQPVAEPGSDEVLVKLKTSAVNPSDVKKRAGSFPDMLNDGHCIPHSDGAGDIVAVGSNVSDKRIGERVWIYQAQYARMLGTCAEYVALDACRAVELPEQATYEEGACMGIPAMTAHRCVFSDGSVEDKTVLITGGAGRVGHYAIQWASRAGATVIATASNDDDEKACKEAGARHVVNHRSQSMVADILAITDGEKVQRVIDVEFGANLPQVLDIIAGSGVIATYSSTQDTAPCLPFYQMMFLDITIRMIIVYAMPESAKQFASDDINVALSQGLLSHRIAATFPLDRSAAAHELIEAGTVRGCVLINCDRDCS